MRASATPRPCAPGSRCSPIRSSASRMAPVQLAAGVADFFSSQVQLQRENDALREKQLQAAKDLVTLEALAAENAQLRRLLDARERLPRKSTFAEILYSGRDPFSRKVIIDKGGRDGIQPGLPVVDDIGVIGQVTRVYPLLAEVTLITDKDQAIPVQVVRNGLRARGLWRGGWRNPGSALHGGERRHPERRRAGHLRDRRHLPARHSGGQGRAHRTRRRLCIRQDRLRCRQQAPTGTIRCWSSARRREPAARRRRWSRPRRALPRASARGGASDRGSAAADPAPREGRASWR